MNEFYRAKFNELFAEFTRYMITHPDFGEDIPVDAVFANGLTGREMHNLYPLLYNIAVTDVTKQERGQGMVWGRAPMGWPPARWPPSIRPTPTGYRSI